MLKSPIKNIHEFIATFFLVGKVPKAPGTFGTLVAAIIYYYLPRLFYIVRGALSGITSHLPLSEGNTGGVLTGNADIMPALDHLPLIYDSPFWLLFLIAFFFLGVYVSTQAEKTMGHDNGHIVIDEVCGYWFALYLFPPSLYYIVFGFLFFRLFDIAKPYPINKLQNLSTGWGVMVDDIMAGAYTAIVLGIIDLIWFIVKPV